MVGGPSGRSLVAAIVLVAMAILAVVDAATASGTSSPRPILVGRAAFLDDDPAGWLWSATTVANTSGASHTVTIFPPGLLPPRSSCELADVPLLSSAGRAAQIRLRLIERAYCATLGRAPEPAGQAYWVAQLEAGLEPGAMVMELIRSAEYRSRFGLAPDPDGEDDPLSVLARLAPAPPAAIEVIADPESPGAVTLTDAGFAQWLDQRELTGLEVVTPALVHGRISGGGQQINVAYVHLSQTRGVRVSPGSRGRATVGTWAAEIGAHVAINGNWYSPWDGPAVAGGEVYGGTDHFYTALFGFTAEGRVIVEHHREVNDGVDPAIVEGVSGHPTLIHRGERTTDFGGDPTFTNRHPRTAIGLDRSGDVLILVTVDGRSSRAAGMTGDETAVLLERLGAHDALMLDGGGSTTMWIAGKGVVNQPSGSLRAVGNQLAAYGD